MLRHKSYGAISYKKHNMNSKQIGLLKVIERTRADINMHYKGHFEADYLLGELEYLDFREKQKNNIMFAVITGIATGLLATFFIKAHEQYIPSSVVWVNIVLAAVGCLLAGAIVWFAAFEAYNLFEKYCIDYIKSYILPYEKQVIIEKLQSLYGFYCIRDSIPRSVRVKVKKVKSDHK